VRIKLAKAFEGRYEERGAAAFTAAGQVIGARRLDESLEAFSDLSTLSRRYVTLNGCCCAFNSRTADEARK